MMNQESHEKSKFFAIIVCNKTDWFHVVIPSLTNDHWEEKAPLLVCETSLDSVLAHSVQDDRLFNDSSLSQYFSIKLFFKDLIIQSVFLRRVESDEFLLSIQNERKSLELVLEMHPHLDILSFLVQNSITEMHKN